LVIVAYAYSYRTHGLALSLSFGTATELDSIAENSVGKETAQLTVACKLNVPPQPVPSTRYTGIESLYTAFYWL
jgi:hypothetical protein